LAMVDLAKSKCKPGASGAKPYDAATAQQMLPLVPWWRVSHNSLVRHLEFTDFVNAIAFINALAKVAEDEGHHPNFSLYSWNKVDIELSTHATHGLTDNDFIMAAKINNLLAQRTDWLKD